ncbi:MAG: thioredoxin [Alphaproteobacteria bacterium]|nr:MAG: thioredoxin [Alphaproteobacteria bacterium]
MDEVNVVEVDDKNWEHLVEKSLKPVIVMFYSPRCSFCEFMEPYFINFAQEFENEAVFARMNVVANPWTAERYKIQHTPTFKSFCHGRPVWEQVGGVDLSMLKTAIENIINYGEECIRKSTLIGQNITGYM